MMRKYLKYTSIFIAISLVVFFLLGFIISLTLNSFNVYGYVMISYAIPLTVVCYIITSIIVTNVFVRFEKRAMSNTEVFKYSLSITVAWVVIFCILLYKDLSSISYLAYLMAIIVIVIFIISVLIPIFITNKILSRKLK